MVVWTRLYTLFSPTSYSKRLGLLLLGLSAGIAHAQDIPRIGILDFYGLRKLPEAKVRQTLRFRENDPLPPSKGDVEERLDAVPEIVESHLEAVCCDAGKVILY